MMEFDPVDAGATVTTFIGTSSMAGIASWSLFDVSLSDVAYTLAGNDITLATLLTLVALAVTIITNDNAELSTLHEQAKELENYYYYSVVGSLGLLVGWVFIGDVSSFVQSADLWGVAYIGISVTGQMAVGYML